MSKMKKLIQQLNEASKSLTPENKEIFGEAVVYIRTSNLKEKDAEEFLQQLLDSFLSAQQNGVSIESVLGTNDYKAYCKNIVEAYKSSYHMFSLFGDYIMYLGMMITILFWIDFVFQSLRHFSSLSSEYKFTLGALLRFIGVIAMILIVFAYIKNTCFRKPKKRGKLVEFLVAWAFMAVFFGSVYITTKLNNTILFQIPIYVVILLGLVLYFVGKYLSEK